MVGMLEEEEAHAVSEEEEFDDGGAVSDDGDDGAGPSKKKRRLEGGLVAGPTVDNVEEAEASLLDLEVRELLGEAGVDHRLEAAVVELAKRVTSLLKSLQPAEVAKTAAKGFLKDLSFTVTKPFTFQPPTSIQQVGSFALGAATRARAPSLDLAVEMPAACFDSKDQLNHRYHAKRALYLAHIAAALKAQPGVDRITLSTLCNDPRKPVLVVHPAPGASPSGLSIRILPVLPATAFPLAWLAPHRNNLRAAGAAAAPSAPAAGSEGATGPPTPHYNTSVLQDLLLLSQHATCQAAASRSPNFAAAAVLLRVWAAAQQVDSGADGLGGFLLSSLLADLILKGAVNPGMSAMHLFRAALVALSNPKTFSGGLFMQRAAPAAGSQQSSSPPDAKAWRRVFPVVFVDASGWLNLAAHVSKSALAQAQRCAKGSLELLNAGTPEAFDAVFLARHLLPTLCDYWYHVRVAGESSARKEALAQDQPTWRSIESQVESLVTQGLGTRAKWVRVFRRPAVAPASVKTGAAQPQSSHVLVGVQVDPTAALRAVDIGPPADQAAAAAEFRQFWGDRSELRRFQDGAICEAVVWDCGPADRHLIPDWIVSYVLQRHLPEGTVVVGFGGALDTALRRNRHVSPDYDVQAARLCEAATERLSKQLRALSDVALRVVSTQALSAVSRHAAVFPPLPHLLAGAPHSALPPQPSGGRGGSGGAGVPRVLEPVEILCQLEGSGKWPENVAAFLKAKAALGVQLARALAGAYGVEARAASGGYVDVLAEGFAFRLLLATERDAAMQAKALAMAQATRMEPALDLPLRAWHQGTIAGVAGTNPAFEPTARLAQRWVAAHLLSPHLAPEAVELLVAHCFTGVGAPGGAAPGSRTLGLLRFLRLLCDHPWRVSPLIVDPVGELGAAQKAQVLRQHSAKRAAGTCPAMYLVTPKDPECQGWTYDRPSAPVLHRITVLAKRSADALEGLLSGAAAAAAAADAEAAAASPSPAAASAKKQKQQQAAGKSGDSEAAAAEAALARLFGRDEREYDVLLRLRQEALPNMDRGCLLPGQAAAAAVEEGGEDGALAAALKAEQPPVNKHCRAILKGIPQSVVHAHSAAALRRELLVGFEPVPLLVEQLEQRFGELAVFCADYVGGADVVAVKWRKPAFARAPLKPELAYALRPAAPSADAQQAAAAAASGKRKLSKAGAGAGAAAAAGGHPAVVGDTEPDVGAILADVLAMGAGLVDSVELLHSA